MQIKLFLFDPPREAEREADVPCLMEQLRTSKGYLFVPSLWLNVQTEIPILILALGIYSERTLLLRRTCHLVSQERLGECVYRVRSGQSIGCDLKDTDGGGAIRIENNTLVFFDASEGLGDYNRKLLKLAERELCEKFGVTKIEFRKEDRK